MIQQDNGNVASRRREQYKYPNQNRIQTNPCALPSSSDVPALLLIILMCQSVSCYDDQNKPYHCDYNKTFLHFIFFFLDFLLLIFQVRSLSEDMFDLINHQPALKPCQRTGVMAAFQSMVEFERWEIYMLLIPL